MSEHVNKFGSCISIGSCVNCVFGDTCKKLSKIDNNFNIIKNEIKDTISKTDHYLDLLTEKLGVNYPDLKEGVFLLTADKNK